MVSNKDMTLRMTNSSHEDGTLELNISATLTTRTNTTNSTSDVESDLGTLIINDETDDEDSDKTLKPAFLQHFELKENMVCAVFQYLQILIKTNVFVGSTKNKSS